MHESTCDVLIVAPLDIELSALKDAFAFSDRADRTVGAPFAVYFFNREVDGHDARLAVLKLDRMGVLYAGTTTCRAISELQPTAVISFGIAGGFVGEDVRLLDVLVPNWTMYYEPMKEGVGTPEDATRARPRYEPYPSTAWLHNCAKTARDAFVDTYADRRCIVGGVLASGEKKVANLLSTTVENIKRAHDKVLGVEMEAAGVAQACLMFAECQHPVGFIAVKGISDDASAGENNKTPQRRRNRRVAAQRAAEFIRCMVDETRLIADIRAMAAQTLIPQVPRAALEKKAAQLLDAIPDPIASHPPPKEDLIRHLDPLESPPVVFYHWRQTHEEVHWIDFAHLQAISNMKRAHPDLMVNLLVTDREISAATRRRVERLAERLIGEDVVLSYYSDEVQAEGTRLQSAIHQGFLPGIDLIRTAKHVLGHREGNIVSQTWMCYIVDQVAKLGRNAIVLVWHRSAGIYKSLQYAVRQRHLLLVGRDATWAPKIDAGSEGLYVPIDPPRYKMFRSALTSCSSGDRDELMEWLLPFEISDGRVRPAASVVTLEDCMDYWNARFFRGFD